MRRIVNTYLVATVAFLAAGFVLAEDQKDPKAVLEKALKATGGEENLGAGTGTGGVLRICEL